MKSQFTVSEPNPDRKTDKSLFHLSTISWKSQGGKMITPLFKRLYTQEELQSKVVRYQAEYEQLQDKKDFRSMASACYDIGCLYELLNEEEKSRYYYQKVVDGWNAHPDDIPYYMCVHALKALKKSREAFEIVLAYAPHWDLRDLASFYEKLGRPKEAHLLYAGLATFSAKLSRAYHVFWRPHYFQKAADLWEKAELSEMAHRYSKEAVKAWEKMKDTIEKDLELIEEAWLYEEVGYIYEKAGRFKTALEYYEKAKSKYEEAYTEDPDAVFTYQVDGDWDDYWGFFAQQISDFRLIYFLPDGPEENDYRRIKYRILNLKGQMKDSE
jgi:tetratricopeptide (TPR) repeat protein